MDFNLTDEQQMLVDSLRRFVRTELEPHEDLVEKLREVPRDLAAQIRRAALDLGFYALNLPVDVGGGGLDYFTQALCEREFGHVGDALATVVARPAAILLNCRGDQIGEYLLPTARGEKIECFALTEPGAGSDARGITTTARRIGGDYVINGTKQFISHADIADFIILFAVTGEEDSPQGRRKRFTAFLVDADRPGVSIKPLACIAARGYNPNMIYLDNVRVGADKILGEEGGGFDFANDWLYSGRIMLAAHCVGRARRVLAMAAQWSATRTAFGQPIGRFQGTSFKLADMATELHITDLMVDHAAWAMDRGAITRREASMVNLFASEMIGRVTDHALQIYGGLGLMEDLPIQRFWRDARVQRIWEGTSEVHRDLIARDLLREHTRQ
jgi:acyl-CoA dehydrogenase